MRPVRSALTAREWEVLDLMTLGASTQEIANDLLVSLGTVQSHVKHILRKFGVHSRTEAIARAHELRGHRPTPK
jgi:NarL family two-component system response regulator LiaR